VQVSLWTRLARGEERIDNSRHDRGRGRAGDLVCDGSVGADEKGLAPLVPFAEKGAPTNAALAQELRALIPALMKLSGAQAPTGFLERLEANASKLVRIRPVDAPAGDDASAVLARIEIEAAHAAIDDAIVDLGKLDAATRAPAQEWIRKAQARQAAFAAVRQFASEATHALGKR